MPEGQSRKMMKSDKPGQYEYVEEGGDISSAAKTKLGQEETRGAVAGKAAEMRAKESDAPKQMPGESISDFAMRMRDYREKKKAGETTTGKTMPKRSISGKFTTDDAAEALLGGK